MDNGKNSKKPRRGFTIIELLVVISIMAVLAMFAIGAALKSVKQSRYKRIDATCRTLEMALENYHARENKWPGNKKASGNDTTIWYHGVENLEVFQPLYTGSGGSGPGCLEGAASSLMAYYKGSAWKLNAALSVGHTDVALMYPDPETPNRIRFYCVEFRLQTDTVKVHRQDDHGDCPELNKY
jgi:prepilin-type N-terminal cleavage/methylation domain-containing protein